MVIRVRVTSCDLCLQVQVRCSGARHAEMNVAAAGLLIREWQQLQSQAARGDGAHISSSVQLNLFILGSSASSDVLRFMCDHCLRVTSAMATADAFMHRFACGRHRKLQVHAAFGNRPLPPGAMV